MGQKESRKNIEQEYDILKQEMDGSALVRNRKDSQDYLMRVVTCATEVDMERLKALLECRAQLSSQHMFSLVEIREKHDQHLCSTHYKMTLVLQYSAKNMAHEMRERCMGPQRSNFQESDLWSILYSCCTALSALYSSGATHESLSADQIFICKDGFVKISEPLLFGLQKNHLEAMRTKEEGTVGVHLSPEIIGCLDDQNFFYYDKQKSDIFVLGMIVVDLALLSNHFLYNPRRKKPLFEQIQGLLQQVGEHFSQKLVNVLGEMLQIESRKRPSLIQIINKVEKFNNIGDQFTVETESNIKSQAASEREQERVFERPVNYQELSIRQDLLEKSKRREPVASNVFTATAGGHSIQQQSLCIKEPSPAFNQQNFDGRVFASTPHHSSYHQTLFTSHHQYVPAATYYQSVQTPSVKVSAPIQGVPVYATQNSTNFPVHFNASRTGAISIPTNFSTPFTPAPPSAARVTEKIIRDSPPQNFNLYQRSKSIDSIKVVSNQYPRVDQVRGLPQSATKATTPFSMQPKEIEVKPIPKYEPLFTHEIPEVYNILVKSSQNTAKAQIFTKQEKDIIANNFQHVPTPQFQGEAAKVNRFTSFKNYAYETVSRSGEEPGSPLIQGHIELRKNISHTQSEYEPNNYQSQFERSPPDPFAAYANNRNNFSGSTATPFKPPSNHFTGSSAFPSQAPPPISPFANSAANFANNNSPIISSSFIPAIPSPVRQAESFTCRSGFSHHSLFHKEDDDIKLQFVKEDIEERGHYEGYKHNDMRNGHGTLYFKDGGHYEGEWKDDKMHGFGKLYYENGKIAYEGHWENDEFNGQGRVYNSDPVAFEGEFNYKDFSELGNQWVYYEGLFKNDSKHGKGYIKLSNGEMFEGLFDHDMIEGNGIFYKRAGQIIIGFWIDNKLFLNQSYEHDKK